MARAPTTTDAFNAVAEPRRRQILDLLSARERTVGELALALGLSQPLVSKHLRVLREVGLVTALSDGRRRLYRLNGDALRPVYDWVKGYEASWTARLQRMDAVVAKLKRQRNGDGDGDGCPDGGRDAPGGR
jgi:DNA-binding transcriptional ArsR family regulator